MDPQSTNKIAPAMDVVAPSRHTEQLATPPAGEAASKPSNRQQSSKASAKSQPFKAPKQRNGVGLAIAATVVIVLGLGLMAVFAYLKQNNQL